jgi:hypothetical protein
MTNFTNQTIDEMEAANYFGSAPETSNDEIYMIRQTWTEQMSRLNWNIGDEIEDWQQDGFDDSAAKALIIAIESVG